MDKYKKIGIWSLALLISLIAVFFSHFYIRGFSLGTIILNYLNIPIQDQIFSVVLFILAIVIGYKNKKDLFAIAGKNIAFGFIVLYLFFIIIGCIQQF